MKIATYILLALFSVSVWTGCDIINPPPGDQSSEQEEPNLQCNAEIHSALVSGDAGDSGFIWLGLLEGDSLLAHGEPIYVSGPYEDVVVDLQVGYWSDIAPNEYELQVFESGTVGDVGLPERRVRASLAGVASVGSYEPEEDHSCCTAVDKYPNRKYCRFLREYESAVVTGISARIEARYGKPCGYPDSSNVSMAVVWCGAAKLFHNGQRWNTLWAQTGVGWQRNPPGRGNTDIWEHMYTETIGNNGYWKQLFFHNWQSGETGEPEPPLNGEARDYKAWLDKSSGEWRFAVGGFGLLSGPGPDSVWLEAATHAKWASEIIHYEDDMPGTVSNPCNLWDLAVELDGTGSGYSQVLDSYEEGDTVYSDDPSLWGIERTTASAIGIWDIYPNPSP